MSLKHQKYMEEKYWLHKLQAYVHFEGICQTCGMKLSIEESVLHHTKYAAGYMERDDMIIEDVRLLCYPCHHKIHFTLCGYCGKETHEWRALERARSIGLDIPVCRPCYKQIIFERLNIEGYQGDRSTESGESWNRALDSDVLCRGCQEGKLS